VQIVQSADEEQVGDLLDDFDGIGDAAGPEGIPDLIDLILDGAGDHGLANCTAARVRCGRWSESRGKVTSAPWRDAASARRRFSLRSNEKLWRGLDVAPAGIEARRRALCARKPHRRRPDPRRRGFVSGARVTSLPNRLLTDARETRADAAS